MDIERLKSVLAALELRPSAQHGRFPWTHAQAEQLSKARIAVRAEIQMQESRLRMEANDGARARAERQAPVGSSLRFLMGHGEGR